MRFIAIAAAGFIGAAGAVVMPGDAKALADETCNKYANEAVESYNVMKNLVRFRRCEMVIDDRWHDNWDVHFSWCKAQTFWAGGGRVNRENAARARYIKGCRPPAQPFD
jgi:hypothetical protein